ncbi:MAG: phosphotransferase [Halieaceae bacterium]|jgi:hydroxylysine kinase|nr:phosphotransferase [Halieaceae bacterium]
MSELVNGDSTPSVAAPMLRTEFVAETVNVKFGLSGDYVPLVSERDQNFRLTTREGSRFVVKIASAAEARVAADFQIDVLVHLEDRGVQGVPRIQRTVSGETRSEIRSENGSLHCLRVVTWVDGDLLNDVEITPDIASRFGHRLAELDMGLESFANQVDIRIPLWDTLRAGELRDLLVHVGDHNMRSTLESVLDQFELVVGTLGSLPRQVIHNDANTENILIDAADNISGFIDFGDIMWAPRIVDVSTAAAYLRSDGDDRLQIIAPFVAAYHQRSPLLESEFNLLFDLIRTRLSMTLIILYWRLMARDKDDPYRQKTLEGESDAYDFLKYLSGMGRDAFVSRLKAALVTNW